MEIFNEYNTAYLKRQIDCLYNDVKRLKSDVYELKNPPKFKVGDIVSINCDLYQSSRAVITGYCAFDGYSVDCFGFNVAENQITLICSVDDRCNQKGAKS